MNQEITVSVGKVYIASMNMRGRWAPAPEGCMKLNVTSAQSVTSRNRRDFSPMTPVKEGYKGFWNFESYWQAGKVYEDIPEEVTREFWKRLTQARRRYPNSKGKRILHARFSHDGEKMDYVTSRKKVYVPEYYDMIKDRDTTRYWKVELQLGKDICIYDFDGPRTPDGGVQCLKVDKDLLVEKMNDVRFPFGHGYVVAATLMGILPEEYTATPEAGSSE
jgi:hypothetical protein